MEDNYNKVLNTSKSILTDLSNGNQDYHTEKFNEIVSTISKDIKEHPNLYLLNEISNCLTDISNALENSVPNPIERINEIIDKIEYVIMPFSYEKYKMTKVLNKTRNQRNKINEICNEAENIKKKIEKIDELYNWIFNDNQGIKNTIEAAYQQIIQYRKILLEESSDGNLSIQDEIENNKNTINEFYCKVFNENGVKEEIDKAKISIIDFYKELFGDDDDNNNSISNEIIKAKNQINDYYHTLLYQDDDQKKSIKTEIDYLHKKITDDERLIKEFITEYIECDQDGKLSKKQEFDEFYKDTTNKIIGIKDEADNILKKGTQAGLAGSFVAAKEEAKNNAYKHKGMFYRFVAAIPATFILGTLYLLTCHPNEIIMANAPMLIPISFFIFLPLIWLGISNNKKMNQYYKLEQEYAHKEALARSFEGYKEQIEDIYSKDDNKDLLQGLLKVNIDEFKNNPSNALGDVPSADHPYKMALKMLKFWSKFGNDAKKIASAKDQTSPKTD